MTVARELAAFVIRQRYADLPSRAIDNAEMLIASTVASAALGTTLESSRIIRALETERGGSAESTAWFGAAEKLPVAAAARVNALASDAAASDDSDLRNIVHQGTTACTSALATAEKTGASGEDTLTAIVVGYEVAGCVSTALNSGFKGKGFHGCIVAGFAAAAATAKLMNLSETQVAHALALTATSLGGLSAAANTSYAREYHAGMAAMQGVVAAQAAAKGFTAEECIFEMPAGYFAVYGDGSDAAVISRDIGRRWSILNDLGIKLVPGGHPYHAVAEAAAAAAENGDVAPGEVETIQVSRPGFQGFVNPTHPTDLIGIAHSPAYFAAAGVADRDYTWAHAFQDKIDDPAIRALLGKVRLVGPPTEGLDRFNSGAIVTVTTKDGRRFESTVFAPKGAALVGIAWSDVEAKYRALVPFARPTGDRLEASWQVVRHFRTVRHAGELTRLLK